MVGWEEPEERGRKGRRERGSSSSQVDGRDAAHPEGLGGGVNKRELSAPRGSALI